MTTPFHLSHGPADSPVLLCLHGIGSAAEAFDPQIPLVERLGRRIVAWDAPGYGRSPDPAKPYSLDDWADAAADLITATGGGPVDLLGVSWGGVTATRIALRHPQLLRSLILADSSVGSGTTPERAEAMRARATAVDEHGLATFAAERSPLLVGPNTPADVIAEVERLMVNAVRQPSYTWACASMADTDHRDALALIDLPALVIVGEHDQVTPPSLSKQLAAGIAGAELVMIDDAGHLANQEQPGAFNDAVAAFLSAE
ncbi:MAG: alpha/beta fold hydrolase [Actinomycetota bacterium]